MLLRPAQAKPIRECCAIAIMAKASIPGQTKTRLSPPLTPIEAADLNTAFLRDIVDNVARAAEQADIASFVAFGPPGAAAFFEECLPAHLGLMEVWLPDLGECLIQTAQCLLDLGYGAAVVLNSDSPTLPTERLVATARALAAPGERIVLGPCEDGGYYLLGLKQPHRRLFEDIAWSTQRVTHQTLERAAELGLEVARLAPWYDVDDLDSLRKLIRETAVRSPDGSTSGAYFSSHSAAVLRRLIDAADFADRIELVRDAGLPAATIA
jgi:rSAM/selenodomain-associated transferase 1